MRRVRSQRVTLADVKRAWRLLGDARALRYRPADREALLVDGLCRLFGAENGFYLCMDDYRPGGRVATQQLTYGSVVDPYLDRWLGGRLGVETTLRDDLMVCATIARPARTTVVTQASLLERYAMRDFPIFAQTVQEYGLTDNLVMVMRPHRTSDMRAYAIHRRAGGRAFTAAQKSLARLVAVELRRQTDREPAPRAFDGLSPQASRVLRGLLRGDAPKQVAREMGLSVYTVRDHVKRLLAHFEVHGIQELLSKLL